MLQYLKQEANKAFTENGAITLKTTESDCLDLFATIGAIRHESDEEIVSRFMRAFSENRDIAMKLLFFARDIRGGLGERRVFRVIIKWLAENYPSALLKNLTYISEYGRFDDLLVLLGTKLEKDTLKLIKEQLYRDINAMNLGENVSLLGKWLPSVNTSSKETVAMAKKIMCYLNMKEATYRKTLAKLRRYIKIIENNLRERDYSFDYENQPSKALFKYRNAFIRNDNERYSIFLNNASSGKARLNAATLTPYEIIKPFFCRAVSNEERKAINTTWMSQESYGDNKNTLVVVDGSGSMYSNIEPMPATVALSLGIYFAQRNTGAFKNHFITFSETPQLVEIKGDDIFDKVSYCHDFDEVANTNIEAVFELILNSAVNNNLPQSELPETLIIISDMEFDCCIKNAKISNFNNAKARYKRAGYKLPNVVFWNVASRNRQQPVTKNEQGVSLVSGCSPKLFSAIADGSVLDMTPYSFMLSVIDTDRYKKISA